ncbi:unnamed protein product, partial [Prunus brigantina]
PGLSIVAKYSFHMELLTSIRDASSDNVQSPTSKLHSRCTLPKVYKMRQNLQYEELIQLLKPRVDFHARGFTDDGEEEVYGVKEEAHDADDEDVVPEGHAFESRFKDLVPPRVLLPELGRVEKLRMPVEAVEYGWNV